jgi:phosphate transport system substrate-binding protein
VHRADGSGTTFIFTSYLSAVSNDWLGQIGPGATSVNWPTGQGGSKSPGVMAIVNQTPGAIGYVELSYAIALSLPVVSMLNKSGNYVAPSVAGAAADAAGAAALPADLRGLIVNSAGPKVYPITGFTWVIMHQHQTNASLALGMVKFLWWCIHTGQSYSSSGTLHYAPLPANIVKADEQKLLSVTVNGKQVYNGQ